MRPSFVRSAFHPGKRSATWSIIGCTCALVSFLREWNSEVSAREFRGISPTINSLKSEECPVILQPNKD